MTWPPWHSIECWAADCDGCGCPWTTLRRRMTTMPHLDGCPECMTRDYIDDHRMARP